MAKGAKTRYLILGLLADKSLTGYEIKKLIDKKLGALWMESYGQIYPELKKLANEGMVTIEESVEDERVYQKRYHITDSGKKELISWLKMPPENKVVKYEILLKLFFAKHISKDEFSKHIEDFMHEYKDALDKLAGMKVQFDENTPDSDKNIWLELAALFGETLFKAYIEWAEKSLKILDKSR